jgi:hypothetical protein
MPIDRTTARNNLLSLLAYQSTHSTQYGALLLAVWYDIVEPVEDLYVFEVYEEYRGPEGEETGSFRFPGMGYLWLPGLYHIQVCSRSAFERAIETGDEDIQYLRDALATRRAEILYTDANEGTRLAQFLTGEATSQ